METKKIIFCLPNQVNIFDFSLMIDWAYDNQTAETVLVLSYDDAISYSELGLWEKISEVTDNWLFGPDEDDWIIDTNILKKVRDNISLFEPRDFVVQKIMNILDYAIVNNRSVVFYL